MRDVVSKRLTALEVRVAQLEWELAQLKAAMGPPVYLAAQYTPTLVKHDTGLPKIHHRAPSHHPRPFKHTQEE